MHVLSSIMYDSHKRAGIGVSLLIYCLYIRGDQWKRRKVLTSVDVD